MHHEIIFYDSFQNTSKQLTVFHKDIKLLAILNIFAKGNNIFCVKQIFYTDSLF